MTKSKAKELYADKRAGKRMNCGQSVIAAFMDKFLLDENSVALFASFGSGRAPEGECGAYYAAKFMLGADRKDDIEKVRNEFLSKAGSVKCKEIRQGKRLSCAGCVETAAEFLEGIDNNGIKRVDHTAEISAPRKISLEGQVRIIAGSLVLSGILLSIFVNKWFLGISLLMSCGLIYAGLTDNCMMGMLLMKLPYNKEQ